MGRMEMDGRVERVERSSAGARQYRVQPRFIAIPKD
jgi:hypothetical protein